MRTRPTALTLTKPCAVSCPESRATLPCCKGRRNVHLLMRLSHAWQLVSASPDKSGDNINVM